MAETDLRQPTRLLAVLLFVTYGYFVWPPSWNESSRLDLTRSLVERRTVDIDPYHLNTGDKAFRDGHHYSDKAPGASLLATPVYGLYLGYLRAVGGAPPTFVTSVQSPGAADRPEDYPVFANASLRRALYLCNLLTNGLAGAALGAAFFAALVRRFGVAPGLALTTACALGLGSLVLPYATMFYGHVLAAAFLFGAFLLLPVTATTSSPRRLALAGGLAGLAVLTELPCAAVLGGLAVYAALRLRPRRDTLWFLAGAAGPLLVLLAYQHLAFGDALRPGYAYVERPEFAEGMSQGVMGVGLPRPNVLLQILVGRSRGLLYLSPVLALGFVGLARWLRRRDRDRGPALLAALIVAFFLLMNAGYYMWHGGAAIGPRHMIPALPFLCLGVPFAAPRPGRVTTGLLAGLLAISIANQLAATLVDPAAPLVPDVLRDHVWAHLLRGEVAVPWGAGNLGALMGLPGAASVLPLAVLWALGLAVLLPTLTRTPGGADPLSVPPASEAR